MATINLTAQHSNVSFDRPKSLDLSAQEARNLLQQLRTQLVSNGTVQTGYLSLQRNDQGQFTLENRSRFNPSGDKDTAAALVRSLLKTAYGNEIGGASERQMTVAIDSYLNGKSGGKKMGTVSFVRLLDNLANTAAATATAASPAVKKSFMASLLGAGGSLQLDTSKLTSAKRTLSPQEDASIRKYLAIPLDQRNTLVSVASTRTMPTTQTTPTTPANNARQIREFVAELISPRNLTGGADSEGKRMTDHILANENLLSRLMADRTLLDGAGLPGPARSMLEQLLDTAAASTIPAARFSFRPQSSIVNNINSQIQTLVSDYDAAPIMGQLELSIKTTPRNAFLTNVLQNYYKNSEPLDQRAMYVSMLRECPVDAHGVIDPKDQLVALIKGAGPLLHKYLQEYNKELANPEIRDLIAKMVKKNLAPIPDDVRNAALADLIEKSKTTSQPIRSIEIVRNIGFASLSQAMRVKVTPENGEPFDAVIKIMRPGVSNRMSREAQVIEAIARASGPAMLKTFQNFADVTRRELVMEDESNNIAQAQRFNRPGAASSVAAVTSPASAGPSSNAVMMNTAPGREVSDIIGDLKQRLAAARGVPGGPPPTVQTQADLAKFMEMSKNVREAMLNMISTVFDEAMFEGGFFHGDLHTGNYFLDESSAHLTMIDWGNAHTLSRQEQGAMLNTYLGVISGNGAHTMTNLMGLIPQDDQEILNRYELDEIEENDIPSFMDISTAVRTELGRPILSLETGELETLCAQFEQIASPRRLGEDASEQPSVANLASLLRGSEGIQDAITTIDGKLAEVNTNIDNIKILLERLKSSNDPATQATETLLKAATSLKTTLEKMKDIASDTENPPGCNGNRGRTVKDGISNMIKQLSAQGGDSVAGMMGRFEASGKTMRAIVSKLNEAGVALPPAFQNFMKSQEMIEADLDTLEKLHEAYIAAYTDGFNEMVDPNIVSLTTDANTALSSTIEYVADDEETYKTDALNVLKNSLKGNQLRGNEGRGILPRPNMETVRIGLWMSRGPSEPLTSQQLTLLRAHIDNKRLPAAQAQRALDEATSRYGNPGSDVTAEQIEQLRTAFVDARQQAEPFFSSGDAMYAAVERASAAYAQVAATKAEAASRNAQRDRLVADYPSDNFYSQVFKVFNNHKTTVINPLGIVGAAGANIASKLLNVAVGEAASTLSQKVVARVRSFIGLSPSAS